MPRPCCLMLQQTAKLGDPSSQEAKPVQEALFAKASRMFPAGTKQDAFMYCCVFAEFGCDCGHSSHQRPPNLK